VPRAKPPTDDLPSFEVEDNREVVLLATKAEVSEILYPGAGIRHVSVTLSGPRPRFVTEYGKTFQGIGCRSYLCWRRTTAPLLAKRRYDDASLRADTTSLLLAPTKMQRQPTNAVKRVLGMHCEQCSNRFDVFSSLFARSSVVACSTNAQYPCELVSPSWLDFFQDG
jgi:hypothetical protein